MAGDNPVEATETKTKTKTKKRNKKRINNA